MNQKLPANNNEDAVEKISKAYGLSLNDAKALLVQASEVPNTDIIAIIALNETKKGESNTEVLNQVNDEVHLSRNAPPSSYNS